MMRQQLIIGTLTITAFITNAACEPQDESLDTFHMRIDGELIDFQLDDTRVTTLEQASLRTMDGLIAFDDREQKRYDDAVDLGVLAGEPNKFLFVFSLPEQLATDDARELLVNRTLLPRAAEPHLRLERIDDDGVRTTFRPLDEQLLQVSLDESDGQLSLSFDRLELLDDCDNPLVIEDARIEARARTTTALQDMPRFAELGLDPRDVEGSSDWRIDDVYAPFVDLSPRTQFTSDGSRYELSLENACKTAPYNTITFAFDASTQSAPGIYDIGELQIIAYRNNGEPENLDDDDQFWQSSGRIELLSSDEFLEFYVVDRLELTHMILDGPEPVTDSTQDLFLNDNTYVKSFIHR